MVMGLNGMVTRRAYGHVNKNEILSTDQTCLTAGA
jgi:hypothetical protein